MPSWPRGTRVRTVTRWLWIRCPLEEMKNLFKFIFPFFRSGVKAKRGVEFCHSTRNTSQIRRKMGNGVSLTLLYPAVSCTRTIEPDLVNLLFLINLRHTILLRQFILLHKNNLHQLFNKVMRCSWPFLCGLFIFLSCLLLSLRVT